MHAIARAVADEQRGEVPVAQVQAKGDLDGPDARAAAAHGMSGSATTLPFRDQIQRSFGHHDVSGVRAHVGGPAAEASAAMNARAYASGDAVAFASTPDLHLVAHEVAHVVQQRGGVRLSGGVGRAGDEYEQHADAVADAVVRGESAEGLLDRYAHRGAAGGPAVQHLVDRSGPSAMQTARQVLAHADRVVLDSVIQQLEAQVDAQVATVEFADSHDLYRIHLPHAQIQTLRDQCIAWRRHAPAGMVWDPSAPTMADAPRDSGATGGDSRSAGRSGADRAEPARTGGDSRGAQPARGGGRAAVRSHRSRIRALGGDAIGAAIAAVAGQEGEQQELHLAVRVPVLEAITIDGDLRLGIEHSAEGIQVQVRPALGIGVLGEGGHAELMGSTQFTVCGEDAQRTGVLISTAIEESIRRSADRPPPMFLCVAIGASAVGPAAIAADVGARVYNYFTTGRASDPFWIWLADTVFGNGHAERILHELREHEFIEIADGANIQGAAAQGEGRERASVSGRAGVSERWRAEGSEHGTREREFATFDFGLNFQFPHGVSAGISGIVPLSHQGSGKIEIELGGNVETENPAAVLGADVLARAIRAVITHLSDRENTEAARARMERGLAQVGAMSSVARSALTAHAAAEHLGVEVGVKVKFEFPLPRGRNKGTLLATQGLSGDGAVAQGEWEHARVIHEWEF